MEWPRLKIARCSDPVDGNWLLHSRSARQSDSLVRCPYRSSFSANKPRDATLFLPRCWWVPLLPLARTSTATLPLPASPRTPQRFSRTRTSTRQATPAARTPATILDTPSGSPEASTSHRELVATNQTELLYTPIILLRWGCPRFADRSSLESL
jgi:hypothetical protein